MAPRRCEYCEWPARWACRNGDRPAWVAACTHHAADLTVKGFALCPLEAA